MNNTLLRRSVTIPVLMFATALMTVTAPLWFLIAAITGAALPAARSAPRVLAFITVFLWCETIGVVVAFGIWLRHGIGRRDDRDEAWLEANYALQSWWCRALKDSAALIFRLRFVIDEETAEGANEDGPLMFLRHCSIGDTMFPVVFYTAARRQRLRFVLKKELLFDPCLDIVGNRLPNYFADRSSQNTAREVAGVSGLFEGLPADSGILIYPEGTRFTAAKRAEVIARLRAKDPDAAARAERWPNLLPPRPGGTLALLGANTGRDIVFGAHTGFEGSADFARLFNGSWLDTVVRIRFWRVPYASVPKDEAGQRAFMDAQWDRMSAEVEALATSSD